VRADHGERTRAHFNGEWYADAEGKPRGPDHILIEDLGFIDNLMLHGGVVSRGGAVVVGDAPKGAELTDMTAFKRILTIAAGKLG
jgi:nucleoside 2-deoxyribosyltransferase